MIKTKVDLYRSHLLAVSRSFSLCIAELNEPLREYVGLAYLLCRIIDTIEDCDLSPKQKQDMFEKTYSWINDPNLIVETTLQKFAEGFPTTIPDGEKKLAQDSYKLFLDYKNLPSAIQKCMMGPILTMILGMKKIVLLKSDGHLVLKNILELNHYCFFVAGVVGEILTGLISYLSQDRLFFSNQWENSVRFGLFLQKVNILKDEKQDNQRGLFYFQNSIEVIESLRLDSEKAKDYITSISSSWDDFKVFCSFSFLLGLISLQSLISGDQDQTKISREQVLELMSEIKIKIHDTEFINQSLKQFWIAIENQAKLQPHSNLPSESRLSPEALYKGSADTQQIKHALDPSYFFSSKPIG